MILDGEALVLGPDGERKAVASGRLFVFEGMGRREVGRVEAGDLPPGKYTATMTVRSLFGTRQVRNTELDEAALLSIADKTGGDVTLGTSTLYAAIKRMVGADLLAEVPKPADADSDDPRRRYYKATELGIAVAREEALRIRQLGEIVAHTRLLDGALAPGHAGEGA